MTRLPTVLLCACLLIGQETQPIERAWKLAAAGQRDQAIALLKGVIRDKPGDADARLLMGSLFMEAGQGAPAVAQLSEAVKLRPLSADAQNALGEAYVSVGDSGAALAAFQKAVTIKPGFGVAQLNLGEALLNSGELDAACEHLDRAIQLLPRGDDSASARYLRAKIYTARGDTANAAEELQKAVAMRPRFPQAWSDLGEARKTLLEDAAALAAFQRAVELAPDDPIAQYRLGAAYLDADQPKAAVEHLELSYRLNPADQSTLNALQAALRRQGRTREADEIKSKLATLLRSRDENNQKAQSAVNFNNEGVQLEKAGELHEALNKYRAAVELAPQNVPMRVNYAVALLRMGQWTPGLNELHAALLMDPGNSKIQEALRQAIAQAPAGTAPDWSKR